MTDTFDRARALLCARASAASYELDDDKRRLLLGAAALHELGFVQARNQAAVLIAETMAGDVLWAFQGTRFEPGGLPSIAANLEATPIDIGGGRHVHFGYKRQLEPLVDLLRQLPPPSLITGHSKGGAMANLAANMIEFEVLPELVTLEATLCGDPAFWEAAQVKPVRIEHERDPAPRWPLDSPFIQPGQVWWLHAGDVQLCQHRPTLVDMALDWPDHAIERVVAAIEALP